MTILSCAKIGLACAAGQFEKNAEGACHPERQRRQSPPQKQARADRTLSSEKTHTRAALPHHKRRKCARRPHELTVPKLATTARPGVPQPAGAPLFGEKGPVWREIFWSLLDVDQSGILRRSSLSVCHVSFVFVLKDYYFQSPSGRQEITPPKESVDGTDRRGNTGQHYCPVPESSMFCGLPKALWFTLTTPAIVPVCAGVNVTTNVHLSCAATVFPHGIAPPGTAEYWPLAEMPVTVKLLD